MISTVAVSHGQDDRHSIKRANALLNATFDKVEQHEIVEWNTNVIRSVTLVAAGDIRRFLRRLVFALLFLVDLCHLFMGGAATFAVRV